MTITQHVQRDTTRAVAALPARAVSDVVAMGSDGDAVAWDEVLRQYGKLVSTTVRSFRLQDADARDAVQMTWLRLAENAHGVQWSERLGGWLVTTARRECLRILRQTKRIPIPVDTVDETAAHPAVGPEQHLIDVDAVQTLWKLVEELPPRQRTLLRALFADHPRSYAEVARDAGIPTGAIGPTRARALRQLRRRLDEHGLGPAA
jgi:RNA polymerase sigma factor (sigma-70 family)